MRTAPTCQLCSGYARPWLRIKGDWRRPEDKTWYSLWWCEACRHGHLWPRPDDLREAYRCAYYTHGDPTGRGRPGRVDRAWKALAWRLDRGRHLNADVLTEVHRPPAPPGRLLDIGCGDGSLMMAMRDRGWDCAGVEPDDSARARAVAAGLCVVPGTAENIPDDIGSFDLVVMSHVLEHCGDPLAASRAAARRVAPGGTLVCEVPNNAAAGLRLQGAAWHWLDVPRHLNFFSPASLAAAWGRAGLDVVAVQFCGYTRQFGRQWVETERAIARTLGARPPRSRLVLLAATALAPPERKYDSVRVVAVRPVRAVTGFEVGPRQAAADAAISDR